MLPYRIVRWVNEIYPATVFFLYIGLALATFAVCFLLPIVAVLALVFSIFALVPAVVLWKLLQACERGLARSLLRGRTCPACGASLASVNLDGDPVMGSDCVDCGAAYEQDGARVAT